MIKKQKLPFQRLIYIGKNSLTNLTSGSFNKMFPKAWFPLKPNVIFFLELASAKSYIKQVLKT